MPMLHERHNEEHNYIVNPFDQRAYTRSYSSQPTYYFRPPVLVSYERHWCVCVCDCVCVCLCITHALTHTPLATLDPPSISVL